MDYIGCKKKLISWIFDSVDVKFKDKKIFIDGCAGSGTISFAAVQMGYKKVISNDLMSFSGVVVKGMTSVDWGDDLQLSQHIENMNNLEGIEGFFYTNYSVDRLFFSNYNAKKIDACRKYIDEVDVKYRNYLLYCLLEAMNNVCNTAGVHGAFLKHFRYRAVNEIRIRKQPFYYSENVDIYNEDIVELLKNIKGDIIYIDPPYNKRQYGANYHLYETLVKNDNPIIKGKTGLRNWIEESRSELCTKNGMYDSIGKILNNNDAEIVLFSYNSEGFLTLDDFYQAIYDADKNAKVSVFDKSYVRFKADNNRKNKKGDLYEYLIKIER